MNEPTPSRHHRQTMTTHRQHGQSATRGHHDDRASDLAEEIATACQVLAATGLVEHILGHVSARLGPDNLLVRGRGPRERGLAYTTADDARPVRFDDGPTTAAAAELQWAPPNELPIHVEIMRARPEVTAVVHAHPPAVVALSVAGLQLRPIVGAYDIPAARMAADGVPTWPHARLVSTPDLGRELSACLGLRPVAILYGHGLVSVAAGDPARAIAKAVIQALAIESLARMTLAVHAAGRVPPVISAEDLAGLPDLGDGFNVDAMWRHLCTSTAQKMAWRAWPS